MVNYFVFKFYIMFIITKILLNKTEMILAYFSHCCKFLRKGTCHNSIKFLSNIHILRIHKKVFIWGIMNRMFLRIFYRCVIICNITICSFITIFSCSIRTILLCFVLNNLYVFNWQKGMISVIRKIEFSYHIKTTFIFLWCH